MVKATGDSLIAWLIIHSFNHHKTTKLGGGAIMYEYLIRNKYMLYDADQVRENFKQAIKNNQPLQLLLKDFDVKKTSTVINETKSLCVDDFFTDLRMSGIKIESILKDTKRIEMNKK